MSLTLTLTLTLTSQVSKEFVCAIDRQPPSNIRRVSFDAIAIAEGEWSATCKKLGVTKTVDRFATAIGLIVNMRSGTRPHALAPSRLTSPHPLTLAHPAFPRRLPRLDPSCKETRSLRSFVRILGGELNLLKEMGIDCENLEYLKGETHYIATTVKKRSLLDRGVLRNDLPAISLLSADNVDLAQVRLAPSSLRHLA